MNKYRVRLDGMILFYWLIMVIFCKCNLVLIIRKTILINLFPLLTSVTSSIFNRQIINEK